MNSKQKRVFLSLEILVYTYLCELILANNLEWNLGYKELLMH